MNKLLLLCLIGASVACSKPSAVSPPLATSASIQIENIDWEGAKGLISKAHFAEMTSSEPDVVRLDKKSTIRVSGCTTDLIAYIQSHVPDWKITIHRMAGETASTEVLTPIPKH